MNQNRCDEKCTTNERRLKRSVRHAEAGSLATVEVPSAGTGG